ncbi:MAG: hypothetical protein JWO02_3666 [Solirubrobacterales bacterium]|nr:hypothetical protein [Solirubrobacterales bacterium]
MRNRVTQAAAHDSSVIVVAGVFAALVLLGLGFFVTPDTWLALVSGRVVAHGGPPSTDSLTAWTLGRQWVDQQWLGQWILYGSWRVGGLTLVGVLHAVVVIATFVLTLAGARRRGGPPTIVAVVGLLAIAPILLVAGNIRTQTFALPLFVAVLWLLSEDSRAPSARVFWCFPLLVLWANLHGSVVIGAALVALAGILRLRDAWRSGDGRGGTLAGLALMIMPLLAIVATPYGVSVFSYFHDLFGNAEIKQLAPEWMPTALEPVQLPFFLLGALAVAFLGRHRRRLTIFEQVALVGTLVAALAAARNLAWFGLTAALLLPAMAMRVRREPRQSRLAAPFSLTAAVGVVVAAAAGIPSIDRHVAERYPPAAASMVAAAAAKDPQLSIFTHPRYADWLLLAHPELAGRIPFDIRYELLSEAELRRFRQFREQIGADWRRADGGARLIVMDSSEKPLGHLPPTSAVLLREPGSRGLYADHDVAVILRAIPAARR